ncbi:MAG: signal peptidase I [Anaerolineae bacterium]|nr:signal peptidase I [Anaerolineae bacterium]MCA9908383.1 signal peptidase I [Anaerolineae bacterium]
MIFAQATEVPSPFAFLVSGGSLVFMLAVFVLTVIGWWRMFEKAGQSGFLAIIPFVNVVVYFIISGKPVWWVLLLLIPLVNIVVLFLVHLSVARNFGRDQLFALGLLFLTPIFVLILGFGDSTYQNRA